MTKTAEERRWQAEADARSLIEAEAIKKDATRNKKARIAAKTIAIEKKKEAIAAQKVAKKPVKSTISKVRSKGQKKKR